ncbi:MAG: SDR family NAD(P)-dependent oxidoreductase [Myxococcota bacterium]|nr:SDR family NAD(P)-dependent oxidoreductase [Myxococcota bacterium]
MPRAAFTQSPPKRGRWLRNVARVGNFVLDPTVVFSFDQSGFERHRLQFDATDDAISMVGRTCLVTGANSGLGAAAARDLAYRGATVGLLCRNPKRADDAVAAIVKETGNERVFAHIVDLGSPSSIAQAIDSLPVDTVDVLINNAGVLLDRRERAASGLEQTLATNLVGPWALTAKLMGHLRRGTNSRIIWVSSGGMYTQRLNIGHLEEPPTPFDGVRANAQTKRAMVMLSQRLGQELGDSGVAVHCMHPGWADTPGVERSLPRFWRLTKPILRSPEAGADTIVWLAASHLANQRTGLFWFDREPRSTHLIPGTRVDQSVHDALWHRVHEWADVAPSAWTAR